jgi:hypothetical protein
MTDEERLSEILRMTERYKMDEDRRRVRMVNQPQAAGNAQAIPETPWSAPDLDEYAYTGSPSPPVHGEGTGMPSFSPRPAPAPTPGALDRLAQPYGRRLPEGVETLFGRGQEVEPVPGEASLRPYKPTMRDQLANKLIGDRRLTPGQASFVEGALASRGLGTTDPIPGAPSFMPHSLLDLSPVGGAFNAEERFREGKPQDAVLSVLPLHGAVKMRPRQPLTPNVTARDATGRPISRTPLSETHQSSDEILGQINERLKTTRPSAAVEAPAVLRNEAEGATEKILAHAAENRRPIYPPATEPVFKKVDDPGALTRELVPQTSIRNELPQPDPGTKQLPANDRARPIAENTEQIADIIARDLAPRVKANAPSGEFYHGAGPVLQGLTDVGGLSPAESLQHMGRWSGQGAATSPRTQTPQNLRNASYLLWRQAQNDPLTMEKFLKEGNMPGFGMMGMHAQLGDDFARGAVNLNKNPKPGVFQRNWSGNLADVTADTHNIRGTLAALDELHPGTLPREWFVSKEAHDAYKARGGFGKDPLPVGDIKDTLEGATNKKVYKQTEYGVMTAPWYRAAEKLGVAPATGQAHGWFGYGGRTGLMSPESTIDDLLSSQIEATARATGLHPEKILQLWGRGKIPLAEAPAQGDQSQVG